MPSGVEKIDLNDNEIFKRGAQLSDEIAHSDYEQTSKLKNMIRIYALGCRKNCS